MPIELAEKEVTPKMVLNCPMGENDANADTIGDYLVELLWTLFNEGEGFSGKRPFGNSSWEYEMYTALVKQGYAYGTIDEDGYVDDVDKGKCIELIQDAIKSLYKLPKKLKKGK